MRDQKVSGITGSVVSSDQRGFGIGLPPNPSRLTNIMSEYGMVMNSVYSEMIANSIDAGASNVYCGMVVKGDTIHIVIADDGKGMNKEELDRAIQIGSDVQYNKDSIGCFGGGLTFAWMGSKGVIEILTKTDDGEELYGLWDYAQFMENGAEYPRVIREASTEECEIFGSLSPKMKNRGTTIVITANKYNMRTKGDIKNPTDARDRVMENVRCCFREYIDGKDCRKVNIFGHTSSKESRLTDGGKWHNLSSLDPLFRDQGSVEFRNILVPISIGEDGAPYKTPDGEIPFSVIQILVYLLPTERETGLKEGFRKPVLGDWRGGSVNPDRKNRKYMPTSPGFDIMRDHLQVANGFWSEIETDKLLHTENAYNHFRGTIRYRSELDAFFGVRPAKDGVIMRSEMVRIISEEVEKFIPSLRRTIRKRIEIQSFNESKYVSDAKAVSKMYTDLRRTLIRPENFRKVQKSGGKKTGEGTKNQKKEPTPKKDDVDVKPVEKADGVTFSNRAMGDNGKFYDVEIERGVVHVVWNSDHPFFINFVNHKSPSVRKSIFILVTEFALMVKRMNDTFRPDDNDFSMIEADLSKNLEIICQKGLPIINK